MSKESLNRLQEGLRPYLVGLQHVGHVVADLEQAIETFARVYGVPTDEVRFVPERPDPAAPTRFAFVNVGGVEFELIEPRSKEARRLLLAPSSGGGGLNHVAWRVSDLDACLGLLAERGIGPGHVTPDGPVEFGNRRMVYLDPQECGGLLLELIEVREAAGTG